MPTSSESFSRAARSSLASENSPSSIPSPTYQWTKALLAYIRSNLWSILENTSAMAVELDHAAGSHDLGQVTAGHHRGRLVVDAAFEAGGAPVDELDGPLRLDGGYGSVHVLGDHISSVHEAGGHLFAVSGVALGHHGGGFESAVGDLGYGELLVVGLLG